MNRNKLLSNSFFIVSFTTFLFFIGIPLECGYCLDHSGAITADETWLASNNPHEVTGNITVDNRVTLTIEPGVEILFRGNFSVSVYGALLAEGLAADEIRFTRGPGLAKWYGLYFYSGAGGIFDHCIIEWAGQRALSADSCYLSVSNSIIRHNNYGIYVTNINPYLADNIIENNTVGLRVNSYYGPTVEMSTFLAQGLNNIIHENDTGLYFYDCMNPVVASTAVIENNTTYGVRFYDCAFPTLSADISTSGTGVYFQNCTDISPITGILLTDNIGANGAIWAVNSGKFLLGAGNTISGNSHPLSIDAASYLDPASQMATTGNVSNGIQITGGTTDGAIAWYNYGLPYIITTASPQINAGGTLTVNEGVTVRLDPGMNIITYGELQLLGTVDNQVTFTRNQAARWNVIRYYAGSYGNQVYTNMEFATSGMHVTGASPTVDSCIFQDNLQGYYGYNSASSIIQNSLFINNDYGIRLSSGSDPIVSDNSIIQNRLWGMRNDDALITVNAEDNFWGKASGPRHVSNSNGLGDFVSDYVDFNPWLVANPL